MESSWCSRRRVGVRLVIDHLSQTLMYVIDTAEYMHAVRLRRRCRGRGQGSAGTGMGMTPTRVTLPSSTVLS
jgi:hypothetical protein